MQNNINLSKAKPHQHTNYVVKDYRPSIEQLNSPQFYEAIPTDYSNTKKRHVATNSFAKYDNQDLVS